MKKRTASLILCIISLTFILTSCHTVTVTIDDSSIYTKEDIQSAANVVKKYFNKNFKGCTLNEITYNDADSLDLINNYTLEDTTKESIVLLSEFTTNSKGGDGSLNPNETYENWAWVLSRAEGEDWKIITNGF